MLFPDSFEFGDVNRPTPLVYHRQCELCRREFLTVPGVRFCSRRCERFAEIHFGVSYIALLLYMARTYPHPLRSHGMEAEQ